VLTVNIVDHDLFLTMIIFDDLFLTIIIVDHYLSKETTRKKSRTDGQTGGGKKVWPI